MDLKTLLEANKSKIGGAQPTRKPVDIAEQDRPYSLTEITPIQNNIETSNKAAINSTQSEHKHNTKWPQKPNTNQTQSEHGLNGIIENLTQTTHKPNTKLNTQKTQTQHKVNTNSTQGEHVSTLIGIQRMILLFIFEECKKARSHVTEPLSIIHIASSLEIAIGSIKTSISRLCDKAFLNINKFKNGRGGWSIYEIPDGIYNELLQMETQHKLHTNYTQSRHKVDTKLNTQLNTNTSSSSSSYLINKTTTDLNDDWNFDITPYTRFGFTTSQIKQLASLGVITAAQVEQSLIEFSYDLDNSALPLIKTGKINFLMGLFRSGSVYVSEGFKNEQEAIISEMARRAEGRRKKLLEDKFLAWEANLDGKKIKEIEDKLPTQLMVLHRAHGISHPEVRNWEFNYYLMIEKNDEI